VIGQEDNVFCQTDAVDCSSVQSVQQEESPYYLPQAQLQVAVIPATGHDLNLHYTAPLFYITAVAWLQRYFPSQGN
jgi:hypothetical protein